MKNRQLDATLQSAGLGVSSLRDLAASVPIQVVEVPAALTVKLGAPFVTATIPADSYTGQDADVTTSAIVNFLVTSSDVSDDLAYGMTKALFDNLDQLAAAHSAAKDIKLADALKGMSIPVHPGAMKFYKEHGITQ
jgi:TRAP transporter TAXI family solute receptor